MTKIKILFFVDRLLVGGIQIFLKNLLEYIDREKFEIELLILDDGVQYPLEQVFTDDGFQIHRLEGIWLRKPQDFRKYCQAVKEFFRVHHDYDVVHMNSGSKNYAVLKYAKKYGIGSRIAHSHNIDFQTTSPYKKYIGNIFKYILNYYATLYFACSYEAGLWLFGKRVVDGDLFTVIPNAIDFNKFKPNEECRDRMREELGVKEKLVIGNVARFSNQKNHQFLLHIFVKVLKKNSEAKLLLIGDGELYEEIKYLAKELGVFDSCIFTGYQENVSDYMQAMDVFVLPSKFEGLGIVLIEAQANGIPCFTSFGVVPEGVKVSQLLEFVSLEEDYDYWANQILGVDLSRRDTYFMLRDEGYIIEDMIRELEMYYS